MKKIKMPSAFFFKRIQSLTGLLLVLFLFEHFITNCEASYFLDEGHFFVKTVNFFHSIPYLKVFEVVLIGIPIFFHAVWGIKYTTAGENNAKTTDGTEPSLKYPRNRAYNWQRYTSYVIGILLIFHVVQMRFVKYPMKIVSDNQIQYLVKITEDKNLFALIEKMQSRLIFKKDNLADENLSRAVKKFRLKEKQLVAMTKQSGQALLLTIRDTLKNPFMLGLYTVFVLAASFHGLNGLWAFFISWGLIISNRSQKITLSICYWIMFVILIIGLVAVWSNVLW